MKLLTSLLLTLASWAPLTGLSQGTIRFSNRIAGIVDARVFIWGVTGLSGKDGWMGQLYVSPESSGSSFSPVGSAVPFRSGNASGYIDGSDVTTSLPGGSQAFVQLRVWQGGATYESSIGLKGVSASISILLGDPNSNPPGYPAYLVGLQSFDAGAMVPPIPEPATIALFMAGGLAVATICRNKRKTILAT